MNSSSPDGPKHSWLKRFLLWIKRLSDQLNENDEKEVLDRIKERAETDRGFAELAQVLLETKDKKERVRMVRLLRAGLEN